MGRNIYCIENDTTIQEESLGDIIHFSISFLFLIDKKNWGRDFTIFSPSFVKVNFFALNLLGFVWNQGSSYRCLSTIFFFGNFFFLLIFWSAMERGKKSEKCYRYMSKQSANFSNQFRCIFFYFQSIVVKYEVKSLKHSRKNHFKENPSHSYFVLSCFYLIPIYKCRAIRCKSL